MKIGIYALVLGLLLAWVPANSQIKDALTKRTTSLEQIGVLKNLTSKQIASSKIGIGFETLDRKVFDPSKYYDKVGATGVKWARCQTGWARTETEKGKYDFKWLDDVVDNLLARGIQPWFNVGYGNPIYMQNVNNPTAVGYVPLYFGDECLQAWKNYVKALSKHFKGRVKHFEIWNEADISQFWQPREASAEEYGKLIEITAKAIKEGNSEALIGGCMAGGYSIYSENLFETSGAKDLDFFSFHAYCTVPEVDYPNKIKAFRSMLARNGCKAKIWQGETGYPSNVPPKSWFAHYAWHPSSETLQAKNMLRRYLTDLACGVELTSFFMITDFNPNYIKGTGEGVESEAVWGIIENGGEYKPKKTYHVLKNFCTLFDGDTKSADYYFSVNFDRVFPVLSPLSRLMQVSTSSAVKTFERNNIPMLVYYIPEDSQLQMRVIENVSLSFPTNKPFKNPVLIDMMDGSVYKLKNGLNKLPIADYPLVVTDESAVKDIILKK